MLWYTTMRGFGKYHRKHKDANRQRILNSILIHRELTLRELSRKTGMHRSRVTKHVQTLVEEGSVVLYDRKYWSKEWNEIRAAHQFSLSWLEMANLYGKLFDLKDQRLLTNMRRLLHIENPSKKDIALYIFLEARERNIHIELSYFLELFPVEYRRPREQIISWYNSLPRNEQSKISLSLDDAGGGQ